jgi:hypothetical protein
VYVSKIQEAQHLLQKFLLIQNVFTVSPTPGGDKILNFSGWKLSFGKLQLVSVF